MYKNRLCVDFRRLSVDTGRLSIDVTRVRPTLSLRTYTHAESFVFSK